ncbi:hypothetical protein M0802_011226 [Mischocyttarus mexicanus]|nr:hypothetical protein M0802_011226 [Mischocyttarus mexicanus]
MSLRRSAPLGEHPLANFYFYPSPPSPPPPSPPQPSPSSPSPPSSSSSYFLVLVRHSVRHSHLFCFPLPPLPFFYHPTFLPSTSTSSNFTHLFPPFAILRGRRAGLRERISLAQRVFHDDRGTCTL